jgi:hypothetical protein
MYIGICKHICTHMCAQVDMLDIQQLQFQTLQKHVTRCADSEIF